MKVEYLKRRDYILEKMTELGFKLLNLMVPSISLLRFQKDIIKTPLSSVKTLLVEKAIAIIPGVAFGKYGEVIVRCRMQLAWTLLKQL